MHAKIVALSALLLNMVFMARAQDAPVAGPVPAPVPATEAAPARLPVLWIIGDSTVRNGTKGQKGWGDPIKKYFDSEKIKVENKARGGRSSRSFLREGLWDAILKEMRAGDFVLMQFGHNDGGRIEGTYPHGRASLRGSGEETREVQQEEGKVEVVHTFGWYMRRYVQDARAKGAKPIVLSMIPRNNWKDGKVNRASGGYGLWAKEAAEAEKVPFLDLNELVAARYEALGQEKVNTFFPHEHTHTNEEGAELNAACVVQGIRALPESGLAAYLKAPDAPGTAAEAGQP